MSALTFGGTGRIEVSAVQGDLIGTVRMSITDPDGRVAFAGFYLTDHAGVRTGLEPADRTPAAGVHEKDVVLGAASETAIEPVVILHDGETLRPEPRGARFGRRFERRTDPVAALSGFQVAAQSRALTVTAASANAVEWKCWMRPQAWPTVDGTPSGALLPDFLRVEGAASGGSFAMGAVPGRWYAVAVPYGQGGEPGPRGTASAEVLP